MKIAVINPKSSYKVSITPRNLSIYDMRMHHVQFKTIAKIYGISNSRAQQIFNRMSELYKRGHFHYEDHEE